MGEITLAEYPSMAHIFSKCILYAGLYLNGPDQQSSKFTVRGLYKHAD